MSESISIIRASKSKLTYIATAVSARSVHHRLVALLDTTGDVLCFVMQHLSLLASPPNTCASASAPNCSSTPPPHSTTSSTSKRS